MTRQHQIASDRRAEFLIARVGLLANRIPLVTGRDVSQSAIRQTESGDVVIDDGRSFSANTVLATAATIKNLSVTSLTTSSLTAATGVFTTSVSTDDIVERTSAHGVEIDSVLLKDGNVKAGQFQYDANNYFTFLGGSTFTVYTGGTARAACNANGFASDVFANLTSDTDITIKRYVGSTGTTRATFTANGTELTGTLIVGTDPGGSDTVRIGGNIRASLFYSDSAAVFGVSGGDTYLQGDTNDYIQYDRDNDYWGLFVGNSVVVRASYPASAGQTGLWLFDYDNNTLERVTVGASDSGGTGYKVLRIPN